MGFGEGIKILRKEKGWSQAQLAAKAGLKRSQISMLESGRRKQPSGDAVYRLASALQVTLTGFYRVCGYDVGSESDIKLIQAIKEGIKQYYNP